MSKQVYWAGIQTSTETKALVGRLRDRHHTTQEDGLAALQNTVTKAADLIERLAAENARLFKSGEKLLEAKSKEAAMQPAIAQARREALEEAAQAAIDNQDCDPWEIAEAIRALIERAVK